MRRMLAVQLAVGWQAWLKAVGKGKGREKAAALMVRVMKRMLSVRGGGGLSSAAGRKGGGSGGGLTTAVQGGGGGGA